MSTITPNLTAGMARSTAISRMREMARAKVGDTAANALTTLGALRDVLNSGAPSEYSIYNYEPGSSARSKVNEYHNSVSRISMFNYIFDQSIGLFIDPSDLSTLFQDPTGSTPVTAAGQTVGLALDKSRGLVLGPELRGGGTISTVGTVSPSATYNTTTGAGTLNRVDVSNSSGISIPIGAVGRWVKVSITISAIVGSVSIRSTGVTGIVLFSSISAPGTYTAIVRSDTTNIFISGASNPATATFILNSVKELPGNHATQLTTGLRPLYATLPANGVRNLANGSAVPDSASYWNNSIVSNGITSTKVATGIDVDGLPYADYRFAGTFTGNNQTSASYISSAANTYAITGMTYTSSFIARIIGGTTTGLSGIRAQVAGRDASQLYLEGNASSPYTGTTDAVISVTHTMANAGTIMSSCPIIVQGTAIGSTIDVTYRIKGLQFERGSTRTAYQFNYSNVNITQPPFAQVGALRFDGSDDFLSTPPVGFSRYTTDGSPVRNLMVGASQPNTDVGWIATQSQNGITLTKIGSGTDTDGLPYVDYSVVGTATAQAYLVPNSYSIHPASLGQTYTNSAFLKILSGTPALNTVPIIEVAEVTSTDTYITGSGSTPIAPTTDTLITTTRTLNQATMAKVRMYVVIPPPGGSTVNYTFRLKGLQSELGSTRTAYQRTELTNKMTAIAGVRKMSDVGRGVVVELGTGGAGSFRIEGPGVAGSNSYSTAGGGTTVTGATLGSQSAPNSAVVTGTGDISGDLNVIRLNGGAFTSQSTADQGTGNFANDIIYIGSRAGTTFPFSGYLYHLVLVGKTLTSDQIYAIENYVNSKTGAY
jgi:hypothetical protein